MLHPVCGPSQFHGVESELVHHAIGNHPPRSTRRHGVTVHGEGDGVPHLIGDLVTTQVPQHLAGELHLPGGDISRPERVTSILTDDPYAGGRLRHGPEAGKVTVHQGTVLLRAVLVDEPLIPLVQVHRSRMDGAISRSLIHDTDHPAGERIDDVYAVAAHRTQVNRVHSSVQTCPVQPFTALPQHLLPHQHRLHLGQGRAVNRLVGWLQECLLGRSSQMWAHDVRVVRVQHRRLDTGGEDELRVLHQVLIQRVFPGHEDDGGSAPRPPSASGLLPERRQTSRVPGNDHGIHSRDVHPQLQGVRRDHGVDPARLQPGLKIATFLGQVSRAVRGDDAAGGHLILGVHRDHLGHGAGLHEADRLTTLIHQPCHQGCRILAQGLFGLPQHDVPGWLGRGILVNDFDVLHADECGTGLSSVRRGGTGEDEDRVGSVHAAQSTQTTQHLGHMGAEDPAIAVCLVDDDVLQRTKQPRPPGVVGQDGLVQHVGVGEDVVCSFPGKPAFGSFGVAVQCGHRPVLRAQLPAHPQLVMGQGFRRCQVQGAVPLPGVQGRGKLGGSAPQGLRVPSR